MDNSPSTYVERPLQAHLRASHNEESDTLDLLQLWRTVWAAKWNIALLVVLSAALAAAAPKVEYVDRYVAANGAMGFRQVAKLLQANEHEFRAWLQDQKIMYRLGGEWAAYQNHIDAGHFVVKSGVATRNDHAFSATKFTPKGVNWIAGEWAKHKLSLVEAVA